MGVGHCGSQIHTEALKRKKCSRLPTDMVEKRKSLTRGLPPFSIGNKTDQELDEYCQNWFGMSYEDYKYQRKAALKSQKKHRYFSFKKCRSYLGWYLVVGCYMLVAAGIWYWFF